MLIHKLLFEAHPRVLNTVFSFQGVGIEEFHCIQRCPHFRNREVLLYAEVSSFQGVGIKRLL